MEAAAAPSEAAAPSKKRPREADTAPLPDELALPSAAIMRIVKSKLPEGMMVGSDTKKAFGKICSLFILYLSTMYARAGLNRTKERIHRSLPDPAAPSHVHAHTLTLFFFSCALAMLSAADCAKESSRSTMSAADVLTALRDLEFDDFLAPIEAALGAFREAEKARSIEAAAKRAAALLRSGEGDKEANDEA